ncbi:alpha/beta hydrolase [Lysinibacillus sphaericus]|nr:MULTISPECIES: alpha/beta hydrolase [Lysinibacillus]MBE5084393.1 alpha/beta hydrolase [Bacillus thuringiensis]QPA52283.1 alpha/beta hydrolase [Lysinibacillus sphaericus]QPA61150.1 alpha/beta hydrolase [Lysinibacillus sphaericus]QTB20458.1 alpha/beta hydrolase [Lysinibacillus sphaericus]QTB24940.1 alpha/beta hydrolase [Lysinibacillus sphaericus]
MKKKITIIGKILAGLVIAILLFLLIVFLVNTICSKMEQGKIETYGQSVRVDGKNMNVFIQGEGEEIVVLLPGYGTAAPGLDFQPLVDELSPFYKVVVVEPFGYGLSDLTEKERSSENIVSEVHEALQQLHIERYILMGHSISGLYGLDYVNKYPNEVSGFVGLDSSVPTISEKKIGASIITTIKFLKQSGLARLQVKLGDDPYAELSYDEKTKEQLRMLQHKNLYNSTQLNEAEIMYENFKAAENLSFPKDLPVIFFIQANHPVTDRWVPEHQRQIKNSVYGQVVTFDGDHYLYRAQAKEIVDSLREFMKVVR